MRMRACVHACTCTGQKESVVRKDRCRVARNEERGRGRGALDKKSHHGRCTSRTMPSFIDCIVRCCIVRSAPLMFAGQQSVQTRKRDRNDVLRTNGAENALRTGRDERRTSRIRERRRGGERGWRTKNMRRVRDYNTFSSFGSSVSFFFSTRVSSLPFFFYFPRVYSPRWLQQTGARLTDDRISLS